MDIEIKGALDAMTAGIEASMKQYEGQVQENGKATEEAKAAVKALTDRFEAVIKDVGQRLEAQADVTPAGITAGAEFIKSDLFKQMASGHAKSARIELKNTVLGNVGDGTSFPMQRPGVTPGNFLPLTLRQVIPAINVNSNSVNSLRELANTNAAAEVAHGAAKPESAITFEEYDVTIRTVAHWIKVSNQLLADAPAIASYIDVRLRDGLAQRVDAQLLLGNGTAPNISGLTDAGNFVAYTAASGDNVVDAINRAKYTMWATGNTPDTVIVNPADWGQMERTREGAGTGTYLYGAPGTVAGGMPFGVQVVMSNHMPAGSFLIGALRSSATIFQRSGAVVEAGYVNDDFTKNLVTLRAEERLALAVDRPRGIYYGDFSL